jgi:hypothetical protein
MQRRWFTSMHIANVSTGVQQQQHLGLITCALVANGAALISHCFCDFIRIADVHVLLLLWYACRTEDSSWDVLDSVFVTIAKGAPAGGAAVFAALCSWSIFNQQLSWPAACGT